jgi:hypothetical protein
MEVLDFIYIAKETHAGFFMFESLARTSTRAVMKSTGLQLTEFFFFSHTFRRQSSI